MSCGQLDDVDRVRRIDDRSAFLGALRRWGQTVL